MAETIIIGAGLTGISAAYHLEKHGYTAYKLFEKESEIGGLCRSVSVDGFTFDYTGHLLHINDPYFHQLITELVGFDEFNTIERRSFIRSHGIYTKYPFQMYLRGLPSNVIAECIEGFIRRNHQKKPRTFTDWVMSSFGAGFAKHFFLAYQSKIFAHNLNNITASWTNRFVPNTTLVDIIDGLVEEQSKSVGYNAQFFYPQQGGIVSWVRKFANAVRQPMHLNHTVESINLRDKTVRFRNGHIERYTTLITTMPLNTLISLIDEPSSSNLKKAEHKLLCNSVINFNLGIARHQLTDKHWIYFPEKSYPFYRIGFPHNFAPASVPEGCSSMYGEFAYINKSPTTIKRQLAASIQQVKQLFNLSDEEIITQKIMPISHAYVIYDFWRERHLKKLHETLRAHGIHSIGRYGEWKYASMQEAILDGKQIADHLTIIPARAVTTQTIFQQTKPGIKELQ